jgi:hypothetical protein
MRTIPLSRKKCQKADFEYFDNIKHKRPKTSVEVRGFTAQYKRLEKQIADALFARDEASFAVDLLSDDWVFSRSKSYPTLDVNSPMFRVCAVPSAEREERSNVAKAEMVRLDSVIDVTRAAAFEVSCRCSKHLGSAGHMLWLSSFNRFRDGSNHRSDYVRWLFPVAASSSGDDATTSS